MVLLGCDQKPKDALDGSVSITPINFDKTSITIKALDEYDTVLRGDTISYQFKITNTGENKLFMNDIKVDCSCIRPSFDSFLDVGQTDTIEIFFLTQNYLMDFKKHAVLKANTQNKFHKLEFSGFIEEK